MHVQAVTAQCSLNAPINIADNGQILASILITNASNNDLSTASQGVCSIDLRFTHESVGDLNISLVSPNGTVVKLIENSGSRQTTGTTWDIRMLPNSAALETNPPIKPQWDSDQDWGTNNLYTNDFYAVEDLNNFNAGPVNGYWKLIIEDVFPLGVGIIEAFTINFCDGTSITCGTCTVPPISIIPEVLNACGGDESLSNIPVGFVLDDLSLGEASTFIGVQNGVIVQVNDVVDLSGFPQGTYFIYGMTYIQSDFPDLSTLIGIPLSTLIAQISGITQSACASLSPQFVTVNILSTAGEEINLDTSLCRGDTILLGGMSVFDERIVPTSTINSNGCPTTILYTVRFKESFGIIESTTPTIGCNNPVATLMLGEGTAEGSSVLWYTESGNLLGDPTLRSIDANLPGTYFAIIEQPCLDTLSFVLGSDMSLPILEVPAQISFQCPEDDSLIIRPISTATDFSWQGIDVNFTADTKDVVIFEPGRYSIRATNGNCSVQKQLTIDSAGAILPNLTFDLEPQRCYNDSVRIELSEVDLSFAYAWEGPDGFASLDRNIDVDAAGTYVLRISNQLGCERVDSIEVIPEIPEISVAIQGGDIDCGDSEVVLSVPGDISNVTYDWSGPALMSDQPQVTINTAGLYRLRLTDASGCIYNDSTIVRTSFIAPIITPSNVNKNCSEDDNLRFNQLVANTDDSTSFQWTGPGGYTSGQENALVALPGMYTLIVTNSNQCADTAQITVAATNMSLQFDTLPYQDLDCNNRSTLIQTSTACTDCDVTWFQGNTPVFSGPNFMVNEADTFRVEISSPTNPCTSEKIVVVEIDTSSHNLDTMVVDQAIGCAGQGFVGLAMPDIYQSIEWIDDLTGNLLSMDDTLFSTQELILKLRVEGINGCTDSTFFDLISFDENPNVSVIAPSLNCRDTLSQLGVFLSNYDLEDVLAYEWQLSDISNLPNPVENTPGDYSLELTMANGCSGSSNFSITIDTTMPTVSLNDTALSCTLDSLRLNLSSPDDLIAFNWQSAAGFSSTDPNPVVIDTGVYVLMVTATNGCIGADSLSVGFSDVFPDIRIIGDTLNCTDSVAELSFESDIQIINVRWTDPLGDNTFDPVLLTQQSGTYLFAYEADNDCQGFLSYDLLRDNDTIDIQINDALFFDCNNEDQNFQLDTLVPNAQYAWSDGSGQIFSVEPMPSIPGPGDYTLETTFQNTCVVRESIVVEGDTLKPQFGIDSDTLSCSQSKFFITPDTTGINWLYDWMGPETGIAPQLLVTQPGTYTLEITAQNGCSNVSSVIIFADTTGPTIEVDNAIFPCDDRLVSNTFTSTGRPIVNFDWFGPNDFYSPDSIIFFNDRGTYIISATAENGCTTLDSFTVIDQFPEVPALNILPISCVNEESSLSVITPDTQFTYRWTLPDDQLLEGDSIQSDLIGDFIFTIFQNSTACSNDSIIQIQVLDEPPTFELEFVDSIKCTTEVARLLIKTNVAVDYDWSTNNGEIVNTADSILIAGVGTYDLRITDQLSGCFVDSTILIEETPSDLIGVAYSLSTPSCDGFPTGIFQIDSVIGGKGPFLFQLGNLNPSSLRQYSNLTADTTLLTVTDAEGCVYDTLVEIPQALDFTIDLGPDTTLERGDTFTIRSNLRPISTTDIMNVNWNIDGLDCLDEPCLIEDLFIQILENTDYILTVESIEGCVRTDTISVRVRTSQDIFMPNAFTPNGDGVNDLYGPFFDAFKVENIDMFQVYSGGGHLVYESVDCGQPNACGWDGNFAGQAMNPGIYMYRVVFTDFENVRRVTVGDFALIR